MTGLTVEAEDGETSMFGRKVKTMQTGITITGNAITGTLKYIASGAIANDWGPGYFLNLKFSDADATKFVKVGLNPSVSAGLVQIDNDKNGVFKVTDKDLQKFVILQKEGKATLLQSFDLSGLTLEAPPA